MREMREQPPVRPGDLVDGKYRMGTVLGAGGMGVVVRGLHEQSGRPVAIKFLLHSLLGDARVVQRFEREARAMLRLKSDHIIEVLDVARLPTGEPFIVMEFLDGSDLAKHLAARQQLTVDEALDLIEQACDGVADAHAAGIVHRDIKPGNIFLTTGRGRRLVKILDFGISKIADDLGDALTGTTDLLGSPHYMSPEQLLASRDVSPSGDVWALGVVLYRALAGVLPFDGDTLAEVCARVIQEPHVPLDQLRSDVPPWLSAIVDHCLQKEAANRMPSVLAMKTALRARGAAPGNVTIAIHQGAIPFTPHSGVHAATIVDTPRDSRPMPSGPPPGDSQSGNGWGNTARRNEPPVTTRSGSSPGASRGVQVAAGAAAVIALTGIVFCVQRYGTARPDVTRVPSSEPPASAMTAVLPPPVDASVPDPPASAVVPTATTAAAPSGIPSARPSGPPRPHRPSPALPTGRK